MFSKTQTLGLTIFFGCFVIFLYGPVLSIILLAFQGPEGGLTFPMRGVSLHWFEELWRGLGVVDIFRGLRRSLFLGSLVMIFTPGRRLKKLGVFFIIFFKKDCIFAYYKYRMCPKG